jgi:hypothetical protein
VMLFSRRTKNTGPGMRESNKPIEKAWKTISIEQK